MIELKIPYQSTQNKKIFDYFLVLCDQLNNINYSTSADSIEFTEHNHIYMLLSNKDIYLSTFLSTKNEDEDKYKSLVDVWAKIKIDNVFSSDNNIYVFKFDIKRMYSVLSFSSNYKDRGNINLYVDGDSIYYNISKTVNVSIAKLVTDFSPIYGKIVKSYNHMLNNINNSSCCYMSVDNVDKNSFLIPYFNYKDSLNFTVAFDSITTTIDKNRYIITDYTKNNKLQYKSMSRLRKDKFKFYSDFCFEIGTGFWQILVILQNNKQWKQLKVKESFVDLFFSTENDNDSNEYAIHHVLNKNIKYVPDFSVTDIEYDSFELVGKIKSSEMLLLNKLFSPSKNNYFDFSIQKFIGDNYVYSDNDTTKRKEIDLEDKIDSELPLRLPFNELKHYIGSDLSQKTFTLYIYTDGINIMIEKREDNSPEILDNKIIYNITLSRQYLKL